MTQNGKNRHPKKGDYGYFSWEKKKRIGIVVLMYAIVLVIFFTGYFMNHTRRNVLSIVAIVGVLPAAKWTVNMIMALLQKPADPKAYEITEKIAGSLTHGYELCVTAEQGRLALDAVVVVGNYVVAYTSSSQGLFDFMQKHISKMLSTNGLYGANVKIFLDLSHYEERIRQLASDPDKYRVDLRNAADAVREGETRDEAMLRIIKDISI